MRYAISALMIAGLSACGGSGGGSGVTPSGAQAPTISQSTSQPTPQQPPSSTPSPSPSPAGSNSASFASLLNDVRAANGSGSVAFDSRLAAAAQAHADDMLAKNYFSHTGLDGSTPGDRITAAGYQWRTYGENIAQGQQTENEVLQGWVNSPGHQANNVNPDFEDFGLAKAGSGGDRRWVLVLGAER